MQAVHRTLRRLCLALMAFMVLGGCDPDPIEPASPWDAVLRDQAGALMGLWGLNEDGLNVVGADRGAGQGPTWLQRDGDGFTDVPHGLTEGDLWWVFGFEDGPVFASGSGGTILRRDPNGSITQETTPGEGIVFGLWGSSPETLWAVGGSGTSPPSPFIWRRDGSGWTAMDLSGVDAQVLLGGAVVVNKVWGRGENDVWFVGAKGLLLHWDGAAMARVESGTTRALFTVNGAPDGRIVAVGGQLEGTIVEGDLNAGFADVTPEPRPYRTVGVHHGAGKAWIVGDEMTALTRESGAWVAEAVPLDPPALLGFHATWVAPNGAVWAAGGQILAPPYAQGLLVRRAP